MNWIFLAVVVVLIVLLLAAKFLRSLDSSSIEYPYILNKALFSPAERSFLGVLEQAIGDEYRIFGKVRVADVVSVKSLSNRAAWQRAFNRISAKHIDYVLCSKDELSIVCAIELDDQSHQKRKRQERDAFLARLCQEISLPLLQIPAQRAYSVNEIKAKLLDALMQSAGTKTLQHNDEPLAQIQEASAKSENCSSQTGSVGQTEYSSVPVQPSCPKCAGPMVKREIKSGSNAGKQFWGCTTFPKCRGIVSI